MWSLKVYQPRNGKEFMCFCIFTCVLPLTLFYWYAKSVEKMSNFEHFEFEPRPYSYHSQTTTVNLENEVEFSETTTIVTVTEVEDRKVNSSDLSVSKKPVILMWSKYYNVKPESFKSSIYRGKAWDPKCCEETEVTFDRTRLEEATAIVFFHYFGNLELKDLPKNRTHEQLWVLFSKESPRHSPNLKKFDKLFNLTMSYRLDSDIFSPYGYTVELEKPLEYNQDIMINNNVTLDDWIAGKSKLFAGVISHCPTSSKREGVAKKIKKDLDIYGSCGVRVCPRNSNKKKCDPNDVWKKIAKEYKFYFAAENAICHDYITEKFWRTLDIGIVPVVYGGGNYSAVAPPDSYIDSRDFKSPADLSKFLKKVGSEKGEYRKYFEWRRRYSIRLTDAWHGWCDLCKYVKNYVDSLREQTSPEPKMYSELQKWWGNKPHKMRNKTESACSNPFWKL